MTAAPRFGVFRHTVLGSDALTPSGFSYVGWLRQPRSALFRQC